VLVSCKGGAAYAGVLYSHDPQVLVLRNARAVGAGDNRTDLPVDGEVLLFVADVDFVQIP
jgi:small nuclear ribonucleoprotein (snRNP)-like protein